MRRRTIIGKSKGGGVVIPPVDMANFVMEITTTTTNQTFTLPTRSGYNYNATVLWGDGTQSSVTGHNINNAKTYTTAGTYNIEIKGTFDAIYFNDTGSKLLIKKILSWGGVDFDGFTTMDSSFYGCSNLNELATGGIKEKSGSAITDCNYAFGGCSSLTNIPVDLFRYNTAITAFSSTFLGCSSLTSLPVDLFRYNTLVTAFYQTFRYCSNLSSLPTDLFRYNTAVTTLSSTFNTCSSLTSLPANLFHYNTAVTNFSQTFQSCSKLQLRSDIFGATPNFGTRVMNFTNCFNRASFTGTQGTAPALWSATMNASSTKTSCFGGAGNNDSSIQNYTALKAANPTWF